MGAEPYDYIVGYEPNIQQALDKLRQQVFDCGQFNGAELNASSPEEALEMTDADGTQSILDIMRVSDQPDYFCAAPFSPDQLTEYFGTCKPTRKNVEQSDLFWDDLERGQARYVILHDGDEPAEIYFVGYSFD